jgi:hypothetical protein
MARKLYLDINTRPREALRVMDQIPDELGRYRGGQRRLWLVIGGLAALGLIFVCIDVLAGYSGFGFGYLAGVFWTGVGVLIIYSLIRGIRGATTRLPQEQFDTARQIIHTLRDDVGRTGRVTGWLDLTGPQQKSKLLRTGRTSSGYTKYYYRDPWFSAKILLVDGNLLRLTLLERIKVKRGYVAGHRHQLKAKLVVNSQMYDVGSGQPLPGLTLNGSIFQLQGDKSNPFTAQEVLASLKAMYSYLQPRQPVSPAP